MSVGSDPIECCVRGRFLCVCVTARRRGFRGGAFCVGAPRNFFRPVSRAFPASVSRRGGIGVGFLFPLCCAFRLVPALRRGPFASGLRETSFDLFRAPSRHRFRGGGGSAWASFSRCAAHFGSCRLFAARPSPDHGRWPDFVRSAPRQGGGRHCFLSLRFGGRGPCRRFSRSGRLRTKVRIAFDGSKTRCMLRPFRAGPLPSAGPAAEEDGPSLSIRER